MDEAPGAVRGRAASALAPVLPAPWGLRHRTDADLAFLSDLYASTREEELQPVPWPPQAKRAFLQDQFEKQHAHYLGGYPVAEWLVLEHEGRAAGRMYIQQTGGELRLMDVALLPGYRNAGFGTSLMNALLNYADSANVPVTLHVEPFNPAMRLYVRLGFREVETRGYYLFMERPVRGEPLSG